MRRAGGRATTPANARWARRRARWPAALNSIGKRQMNAKPCLDAIVVVYAFSSGDPRNEEAAQLLQAGAVTSVQVLNEFVHVSRRKQRRDWEEIEDTLD